MIHIKINEQSLEYEKPITILEAAKELGVKIPTLCHNDYIQPYGGCRLCLVEVATEQAPKRTRLMPACCTYIAEGQIVHTDTEKVREARKFMIELYLSRCPDSGDLQRVAREIGVAETSEDRDPVGRYLLERAKPQFETKCILCGLCVRVCAEITERHALSFEGRGIERKVSPPFHRVAETCIGCRSCAYVCPTDTITIEEVT
jgi:NADH dehydrogenase/NADH:ubiquinone oxidoreductase subunit G